MDKLKNSFFQAYFRMPVPRLVVRTNFPEYTIMEVNNSYLETTGALKENILNQSLINLFCNPGEVTPERIKLEEALTNSLQTNEQINIEEFEISSLNDEADPVAWWQVELMPVAEEAEQPAYLIVTTRNITRHILSQKELHDAHHREQTLHEELAATNEELFATNEELSKTVESLKESQESLVTLNKELEQRVMRRAAELFKVQTDLIAQHQLLDTIVNEVPAGICVMEGPEMKMKTINNALLELWNRDESIIGLPLLEILPEIKTQAFPEILAEVYRTGIAYSRFEAEAELVIDGVKQKFYRDYSYTPIKDAEGNTHSILSLSIDVTERAIARLREQELMEEQSAINEELAAANEELATTNEELAATNEELNESRDHLQQLIREKESAEAKLELAIEAAGLGSWHIDPITKDLHYNAVLARLYGYEGQTPMTYDQAIGQITEEHRELVVKDIEQAIKDGGLYDVSFTQNRFDNGEVIWLRSVGRISKDELGKYTIFSGVVMDITEQKKDEQRKNDFIGMVSHELKTPLTSLNAYAQVLQAKAVKNEDTFGVSALGKVTDQVKKMTTLINGFLNISRLESGKIQLNKQHFNLDQLVKEYIEDAQILSTHHKIIFEPCAPVKVFADKDKIGSVISNLISNAIKYSPSGADIEILCDIKDDVAQISVKDHGMGVPAKDLPRLFDRFYRVESEAMHLISGFGIGLYLSAEIVQHHNGKIWAESEPGKGSVFHFSLPV
ncbi:ATP-binding protein [Pedobacter duraquae]|nr:ATP-binding protein [Pedobacter duraquae]